MLISGVSGNPTHKRSDNQQFNCSRRTSEVTFMLDLQNLIIDHFVSSLRSEHSKTYVLYEEEYGNIISWAGRLALENIANSDMLYHNVEHTIMVTTAGLQILRGKHISEGHVTAKDWLHYVVALVCHDIGYVYGICNDDTDTHFTTGRAEGVLEIQRGGTCAALTPYHVDRGKRFIHERFGDHPIINADIVASYIEMTRFPPPAGDFYADTKSFGGLVRAADLIGQMGDPNYLRKLPGLFYEFEETGTNKKIGYTCPDDMRVNYAKFYWGVISRYVEDGIQYLRVTQEGKQWVANLYGNIFSVEHEV